MQGLVIVSALAGAALAQSTYGCSFPLNVNGACPLIQIADGQIQNQNQNPLGQISDGQIQACSPTAQQPSQFTLANGMLTDGQGRTCGISIQNQLQCNNPPTVGSQTTGFSVVNGNLAINGNTNLFQCLLGSPGQGYNIYNAQTGTQNGCQPIMLSVPVCASASSSARASSTARVNTTRITQTQTQTLIKPSSTMSSSMTLAAPAAASSCVVINNNGFSLSTNGVPLSQIFDGQVRSQTNASFLNQLGDGQLRTGNAANCATFTYANNGSLLDSMNRLCYISTQTQFQCEYTIENSKNATSVGFTGNNPLSFNGNSVFYSCDNGDNSANIYTTNIDPRICQAIQLTGTAGQCAPVPICPPNATVVRSNNTAIFTGAANTIASSAGSLAAVVAGAVAVVMMMV